MDHEGRADFIICHQAGVSRDFVRVAGHSLHPSRLNFAGAILRRDVIAAESFERQGDLQGWAKPKTGWMSVTS